MESSIAANAPPLQGGDRGFESHLSNQFNGKTMTKFMIRYGLGGGFGGSGEWEEAYANTLENAEMEAYENACLEYESYGGMHALHTEEGLAEEYPDEDSNSILEMYNENRESWLCYEAKEVK